MKVIYKKTLLELLRDAQREAAIAGKEIEKVILTKAEIDQLKILCHYSWELSSPKSIYGMPIEESE